VSARAEEITAAKEVSQSCCHTNAFLEHAVTEQTSTSASRPQRPLAPLDTLSPGSLDLRRNHMETSAPQNKSSRSAPHEQTSQEQVASVRIEDTKEMSKPHGVSAKAVFLGMNEQPSTSLPQRPLDSKLPDYQPDSLSPDFLDLRRSHKEASAQALHSKPSTSEQTSQGQVVNGRTEENTREVSQRGGVNARPSLSML